MQPRSKANTFVLGLIQARMGSTRLPGKVMKDFWQGMPMLGYLHERVKQAKWVDKWLVITPRGIDNQPIWQYCLDHEIPYYVSSFAPEADLLSRHIDAAKEEGAQVIVRVPSDNPFSHPGVIDELVAGYIKKPVLYGTNFYYPVPAYSEIVNGLGAEICPIQAYEWVDYMYPAQGPYREHPHLYFYHSGLADMLREHYSLRLDVNTKNDFELCSWIANRFDSVMQEPYDLVREYYECPKHLKIA